MMRLSSKGIEALKTLEDERLTSYRDIEGNLTIGVGHIGLVDGRPITDGMTITSEKSTKLLHSDLVKYEKAINRYVTNRALMQNEFDALVIFSFNVGVDALKSSTALKRVNYGGDVASALMMWRKARINGKLRVSQGLVNRRQAEIDIYYKNKYQC